jgi:acetoin utilization deacetylase AcuC-like enzyme
MNVAFPPETGSDLFRETYSQDIFPRIDAFEPDLILISAGFDAHADDPLAQMNLVTSDFAWVTHGLCDLADKHCGGRVVSALEGGYNLSALAASAAAHVQVLKERGR